MSLEMPADEHCDRVIDDETAAPALRAFIAYERQPTIGKDPRRRPRLFADYFGTDPLCSGMVGRRCRVVMASRFGDVGVRFTELTREHGYSTRCWLSELQNFSDVI